MTKLAGTINITTDLGQQPQVVQIQLPGAPGPQGPQGIPGQANVLTIGTITTGAAGSSAVATITGVSPNQTLNLTIPQGIQGVKGDPNVLTIGTVTTTDAITGASATITGTTPNQVLNLVLPRGYGVIPGGAAGTVLVKASGTDYDTGWETPTGTGALVRKDYVDSGDGYNSSTYQTGTAYTFALADATREVDYGGTAAGTFTVPPNSSVAFKVGTVLKVVQFNTGQLTLAPGAGVSLHRPPNFLLTARQQFSAVYITKRDTDDWMVSGDLTLSPSNAVDIATKGYVDTQDGLAVKNTGQQVIDDSAGAVTDNVLTLKAAAAFTGAFMKLNSGGTDYMTLKLSSTNEPTLYNPVTSAQSSSNAVRIGNPNGSLRILPFNDGNTYIQSTLNGLAFTGLNGADGTNLTFGFTAATFHGSVAVAGKVTNVTDPTAAQDAATKNYVDGKTWPSSAISDATASTTSVSTLLIRDAAGTTGAQRFYANSSPVAVNELTRKDYVDGQITTPIAGARKLSAHWGSGTAFPTGNILTGDTFLHTGLGCIMQYNGTTWHQREGAIVANDAAKVTISTTYSASLHAGFQVWDTGASRKWEWNGSKWLFVLGANPFIKVRRTTTIAATANTWFPIPWEARTNTGTGADDTTDTTMWAVANATRLVAPIDGLYFVDGSYGLTATGNDYIGFKRNGSAATTELYRKSASTTSEIYGGETMRLAAGQYVEVVAYTGGSTISVASEVSPEASLRWVGNY